MTLIYDLDNTKYTLEELVEMHPKLWKQCLKEEYDFWSCSFGDLIIEASDVFEEILITEYGYNLEFKKNTKKPFDLNILFKPLLNFFIKE